MHQNVVSTSRSLTFQAVQAKKGQNGQITSTGIACIFYSLPLENKEKKKVYTNQTTLSLKTLIIDLTRYTFQKDLYDYTWKKKEVIFLFKKSMKYSRAALILEIQMFRPILSIPLRYLCLQKFYSIFKCHQDKLPGYPCRFFCRDCQVEAHSFVPGGTKKGDTPP